MWEHQNEHFVRDFLQFSHFVASKSMFAYEFSFEPENLLPQKVLRLPRKMTMDASKVLRLP